MTITRRSFSVTLASLPVGVNVLAATPIYIAGIDHFDNRINGLVLQEIYRRAGLELIVMTLPPARGTLEASNGRMDGEVGRVKAYGDLYPSLIRVEPAFYNWIIMAYYKKAAGLSIKTAADLKLRQVGIVRGVKAIADLTKDASQVVAVTATSQLIEMLELDRIEVAVEGKLAFDDLIQNLGIKDLSQTELTRIPIYHYLHEKHRDLVPVISAVITQLLDRGELPKIFNDAKAMLNKSRKTPA